MKSLISWAPVNRPGRVVRVAEVDEAGALDEREQGAQVGLQRLRVDRRRLDRVLQHVLGESRRIAVGRRRDDQVFGRRHEDVRRVFQQLLRPDTKHHVLAFAIVQLGNEDLEVRVEWRAVERIAVGLGELPEDRVDRGFTGTERVFVAADANGFHSRREIRTRGAGGLPLLRERDLFFMTASGDEGRRVRGPTDSQALKETAARHRHGIPPSATATY
jgi:hypothetical protein